MARLRLAISTCPNDTYAFAGLLRGAVASGGLELAVDLCDIQGLNERLAAGRDDILKASFHAALAAGDAVGVLPVGAALGYGVGPIVLSARTWHPDRRPERILAPGPQTTAALLFEALHPEMPPLEHVVFSEIVPALEAGEADWGVCIHEARFTWRDRGLALVEDLGARFEESTGSPIPLGGLVARRTLDPKTLATFVELVRESLAWAAKHRDEALHVMRTHAQEHTDDVLWEHVRLYVNDTTRDLGEHGARALAEFAAWAGRAQRVPQGTRFALWNQARETFDELEASSERVFHLAPGDLWKRWKPGRASWEPASLETEGFVHLSTRAQLAGTLEAHFHATASLTLLELDASRLGPALRWEPSRGGALFPHLHRAVEGADVRGHWALERGAENWVLPQIASKPEADAPPASPVPA